MEDYWEGAGREANHEAMMEGIGNMVCVEADFIVCDAVGGAECICEQHRDKPHREPTPREEAMQKRVFDVLYKAEVKKLNKEGNGW